MLARMATGLACPCTAPPHLAPFSSPHSTPCRVPPSGVVADLLRSQPPPQADLLRFMTPVCSQ